MASIRQVAKEAGVSIATVSRVMNGADGVAAELRRDVMQAVETCGYSPSVGRKAQDQIALVYAGPFTLGSPFDSACLDGMVSVMRQSKYDLSIVDVRRDRGANESYRQYCSRKGIHGAIVRCTTEERSVAKDMAAEGIPVVVLGDHFEHSALSFAYSESKQASREAVEHLVSLGHKRIAFVACHREDGDHADRLHAYQEVLSEHDCLDESLVHRVPPSRMDGGPILRRLIGAANRPTAMYIADPLLAAGVLNEAHKLGVSIPGDLSIVGFDDTDLRNLVHPRMSAVCQDCEALGRSAYSTLLAQLAGGSTNGHAKASKPDSAWFEVHDTTAPPPAQLERILPSGTRMHA